MVRAKYPSAHHDHYIVDELLTVLKVRGEFRRALEVGPALLNGDVCDLEWITQDDIKAAWRVFSTYRDKQWSFTDCTSRAAMERLGITTAVAFDEHFRQFGTVAIVP
jgi:predicted nucleic acid-binding protein